MSGAVRGRYAPSPTGALHLGNLRTALLAWLLARSAGGAFVLRMEDLDTPRVRAGAAERILADLRWLGLDWDEGPDVGGPYGPYVQSARQDIYLGELARLRALGLLYPCYCTRAELRAAAGNGSVASAPHAGDQAALYPGTCRDLTAAQRQAREAAGRRPSLRFRVSEETISFTDRILGPVTERVSETTGDFIVRRSDGLIAYNLAVVVDDALMAISQVARGADLLSVTAPQRALALALGYAPPHDYFHLPLATDATGARLAKRDASAGVAALRARGLSPERVVGVLAASVGLWPVGESATPRAVLATFDPARINPRPSPIAL
ncbi:MAG TPA: tRNA glutamyl-Q(34) synthetase GluQRS [Ktedonobacterales bacterium]